MQVKAIRDHYTAGEYHKAGDVFEHNGKLHEHIKLVKQAPKVEEDTEDPAEKGTGDAK